MSSKLYVGVGNGILRTLYQFLKITFYVQVVFQVECPEGFLVEWEECRAFQEECLEECPAVWEAHQAVWVVLGCQILVNYYLILSCCRPSRYFCLN